MELAGRASSYYEWILFYSAFLCLYVQKEGEKKMLNDGKEKKKEASGAYACPRLTLTASARSSSILTVSSQLTQASVILCP